MEARQLEGCMRGGGPMGGGHGGRDGDMQLVADWAAKVQERGDWTLGSCPADYQARRGLGVIYLYSVFSLKVKREIIYLLGLYPNS